MTQSPSFPLVAVIALALLGLGVAAVYRFPGGEAPRPGLAPDGVPASGDAAAAKKPQQPKLALSATSLEARLEVISGAVDAMPEAVSGRAGQASLDERVAAAETLLASLNIQPLPSPGDAPHAAQVEAMQARLDGLAARAR